MSLAIESLAIAATDPKLISLVAKYLSFFSRAMLTFLRSPTVDHIISVASTSLKVSNAVAALHVCLALPSLRTLNPVWQILSAIAKSSLEAAEFLSHSGAIQGDGKET